MPQRPGRGIESRRRFHAEKRDRSPNPSFVRVARHSAKGPKARQLPKRTSGRRRASFRNLGFTTLIVLAAVSGPIWPVLKGAWLPGASCFGTTSGFRPFGSHGSNPFAGEDRGEFKI